jgi:hypothetical protein
MPAVSNFSAFVFAICSSGCSVALVDCPSAEPQNATFVQLEYRAVAAVGDTPPIEVQETPSYAQIRETARTIALKFPDSCRTEGAAMATGTANSSNGIMGTNCGVWLAEVERALTEQHYKVISWSALRQQQDTKQVSTYDAARTLGADVVLVVNSMETHQIERGASAGASSRYFVSNKKGDVLEKFAPDSRDRPFLRTFGAEHAGKMLHSKDIVGLAATLDVTAVLATTGESIWFFRHSVSEASEGTSGMRFLFTRNATVDPLRPIRPEGLPVASAASDASHSTEDVEQSAIGSAPANIQQAEQHKLARQVADECVNRFHKVSK